MTIQLVLLYVFMDCNMSFGRARRAISNDIIFIEAFPQKQGPNWLGILSNNFEFWGGSVVCTVPVKHVLACIF